jgi:hypothetical protein
MWSLEAIEEDSVGSAAEEFERRQFDAKVNAMGKHQDAAKCRGRVGHPSPSPSHSTDEIIALYWPSARLFNNRLVVMKHMAQLCTLYQWAKRPTDDSCSLWDTS